MVRSFEKRKIGSEEARRRGGAERRRVAVYHPSDTLFERPAAEVDQQPYGLMEEAKVGQELLYVHGGKALDGFDLDDQSRVDNEICLERGREADALEFHVDHALTFDCIPHAGQSFGEDRFINALEQSRPEVAMQAQCNVENVPLTSSIAFIFFSASPRLL
jgi:hypothetical protein